MKQAGKKVFKVLFPGIILLGSFYFALSDVNPDEILDALAAADMRWILATLPIIVVSHYLRAIRWQIMLSPVKKSVSHFNAFSALMISYLFNNLIPRSGELARPFILARREEIPVSTTLASVVVERVIDVLSLLILMLLALWAFSAQMAQVFTDSRIEGDPNAALPILLLIAALLLFLMYLLLRTNIAQRILQFTVQRYSDRVYNKLLAQLNAFRDGFAVLAHPRLYPKVFIVTVVMWALYVIPLYMVFESFGLSRYYPLTLFDANVLCVVTSVAIAVAPTPGAAGVYHAAARVALESIYQVPSGEAAAYAFVAHAIGFFTNMIVGSIFLLRENAIGISLRTLKDQPQDSKAIADNQ